MVSHVGAATRREGAGRGYFTTFNTVARGRIARLNTDGSLDTTFVPTGTGFGSSAVMVVAVRADGKVYAGGNFTAFNSTGRGGIASLNADGSLDTTFVPTGSGFNGSVYTPWRCKATAELSWAEASRASVGRQEPDRSALR